MLLPPLRFKTELHLYSSNSSNRPASEWANVQSNGVAPGVANQITEVAHAPLAKTLDMPLPDTAKLSRQNATPTTLCLKVMTVERMNSKLGND